MRKLNFGCGEDIKEGYDNLDLKDFDFNNFPYPIKDNTYDYICSRQVLEHLREPEKVFSELYRISNHNAIIEISVPHFNNEGAFSMLGHISYFSEATFECLTTLKEDWRQKKERWEIISLKVTPSRIGKFIPYFMRRKLSLILRGIFKDIEVKLKVIKE